MISRWRLDKPSHARRRNPGQDRHDFNTDALTWCQTFVFCTSPPFAQTLSWSLLTKCHNKSCFGLFYCYAGLLIETVDGHRGLNTSCRGWLTLNLLLLLPFAFALWCVAERGVALRQPFSERPPPFCFRAAEKSRLGTLRQVRSVLSATVTRALWHVTVTARSRFVITYEGK